MGAPKGGGDLKKPQPQSCTTYLSLIQQYLAVLQVDNATWLAERCIAEYPQSSEAAYLLGYCYYRAGKVKNARAWLAQQTAATAATVTPNMLYLSALCCYDLADYAAGEAILLKELRSAYAKSRETSPMDDWILLASPCPVPNGAAGLALLGKLCRKANRRDQAIKYFRISLQLDPFLFTSFQALAEMKVPNVDVGSIFGGSNTSSSNKIPIQKPSSSFSGATDTTITTTNTMTVKSPLQPTTLGSRSRAVLLETPGLTPILKQQNDAPTTTSGSLHHHHHHHYRHDTTTPALVVKRARQVAARQYYPPSPDTPVTTVTKSMRYLRGLGENSSRSLFVENQSTSENTATTTTSTTTTTTSSLATRGGGVEKPDKESDENVQDILDVLSKCGVAYQHLCNYRCQEALQALQQLPIAHQNTPWALHQQGKAHLEKGDFLSAQRCLEVLHRLDPARMPGLELLSTVYWQLKKEIDLANLAQRALDWDFDSPEAHCIAGNCFSLQKDHETALVFFKRSLQIDPDFTYTHTLSGYEYMANEDFNKAIACFRQALRTDEGHYNAWYGLGSIYHRQEKYDLAEYHFARAVEIHLTSSVLRCNLGMAQNANSKPYQALETLSEAFRLDPRNPQARFQRATIYSALQRPEEALAELEIVRDAAPREATVHFAMGKVLKRLRRPQEAMRCFLTAMDLDPKDTTSIKSAMDKLDEPDADEESMTNF